MTPMPAPQLDRRRLGWTVAAGLGLASLARPAAPPRPSFTLGFSTYGMPKMKTEQAFTTLADLGYDSVELCILPDRDGAPARLSPGRRAELRKILRDRSLRLTALMEQLTPSPIGKLHEASLDRLKRAAELARAGWPEKPPLVETVLGGGKWDEVRNLYRDRLGDWGEVVSKAGLVLAIKPHRFGAMSLPEQAVWIIRQLGTPSWLRLVYDFSHYHLRGLSMAQTVEDAGGFTAFVAVKDVALKDGKAVFLLPGSTGTIDYPTLFRLLAQAGYQGDINCEVSGMLQARTDYDPVAAARMCQAKMAQALAEAGLRKR